MDNEPVWLERLLHRIGDETIIHALPWVYGTCACPDCGKRAVDPEELVLPFSYGESFGSAFKECFPNGLEKAYNAVILVYNYEFEYDENVCNPNAPVIFLASVPYDED